MFFGGYFAHKTLEKKQQQKTLTLDRLADVVWSTTLIVHHIVTIQRNKITGLLLHGRTTSTQDFATQPFVEPCIYIKTS